MADGSIHIDTKINRKGAEQGLKELKKDADTKVKQLEQGVASAGKEVEKLNEKVKQTADKYNDVNSKLKDVRNEMDGVVNSYKTMYSNSKGQLLIEPKTLYNLIEADKTMQELRQKRNSTSKGKQRTCKTRAKLCTAIKGSKEQTNTIKFFTRNSKKRTNRCKLKTRSSKKENRRNIKETSKIWCSIDRIYKYL